MRAVRLMRLSRSLSFQSALAFMILAGCTISIERYPIADTGGDDMGRVPDLPSSDTGNATDLGDAAETVEPPMFDPDTLLSLLALSPETSLPIPTDPTNQWVDNEDAIRFGQFLFFEPSISGNGAVSCASCHRPDYAFTDPFPLAEDGILGPEVKTGRRTPTLINVAYHKWYFWDGRRDTLWGQAFGPYESFVEMGGNRIKLARHIYDVVEVRQAYESVFGPLPTMDWSNLPLDGMPVSTPTTATEVALDQAWSSLTADEQHNVMSVVANAMKAIAAYEMRLVSPLEAPFDEFVNQIRSHPDSPEQWTAMDADAQHGARLFVEVGGCLECHKGPLMMDNAFHNIGVSLVAWSDSDDPGRIEGVPGARTDVFRSSGAFSDDPTGMKAALLNATPNLPMNLGAFKTPSLRNVAGRGPYMHAGQHETLRDTIDFYNKPPDDSPTVGVRSSDVRALELTERQVDQMTAFMEALTGPAIDSKYLVKPDSP